MSSCITILEREHAYKFTRWCDPPGGKHQQVHMHFPSEKVRRYFTDPNYIVEDSKQVRTRRRRRNRNQRRQIIKDGWADYEGEVVRSEDIQLEPNCPEETIAPSQVWREKIVIHEDQALSEPPTTPSSES